MGARPPQDAGPSAGAPRGLLALLTTSMGLANLMLFALGALGPLLLDDLGVSRAGLGSFAALSYGTAAALSLYSGHLTDLMGGRRTLTLLLVTVAAAFGVLAAGGSLGWLLLALLLSVPGVAALSFAEPLLLAIGEPAELARATGT